MRKVSRLMLQMRLLSANVNRYVIRTNQNSIHTFSNDFSDGPFYFQYTDITSVETFFKSKNISGETSGPPGCETVVHQRYAVQYCNTNTSHKLSVAPDFQIWLTAKLSAVRSYYSCTVTNAVLFTTAVQKFKYGATIVIHKCA